MKQRRVGVRATKTTRLDDFIKDQKSQNTVVGIHLKSVQRPAKQEQLICTPSRRASLFQQCQWKIYPAKNPLRLSNKINNRYFFSDTHLLKKKNTSMLLMVLNGVCEPLIQRGKYEFMSLKYKCNHLLQRVQVTLPVREATDRGLMHSPRSHLPFNCIFSMAANSLCLIMISSSSGCCCCCCCMQSSVGA